MLKTRWVAPDTGARVSTLLAELEVDYDVPPKERLRRTALEIVSHDGRLEPYDHERIMVALKRVGIDFTQPRKPQQTRSELLKRISNAIAELPAFPEDEEEDALICRLVEDVAELRAFYLAIGDDSVHDAQDHETEEEAKACKQCNPNS